jgi:galactokinase
MKSFAEVFGGEPAARGDAPGRVNLLGEHTDYSEGFVLPTSIGQRTRVSVRRNGESSSCVYSANLDRSERFTLDVAPTQLFARYLYGSLRVLGDAGFPIPHVDIHVASDVPIGVGLSSSAALEVATLRAMRALLALDLDDVRVAQLAHLAETTYSGVHCGILDQMACSLLDGGAMLFLDTRSLARRLLPLPAGSEILVIDSGVVRTLASTRYNERRAECEEAARMLGLHTLRDAERVEAIEALPQPLQRRARHVITENLRATQAAADGIEAAAFGELMSQSHGSLRDDFEVSIPALDDLVGLLRMHRNVYGAKLTGAGFGGACVALCRVETASDVARDVLLQYNRPGRTGRLLVPPPR